VWRWGHPFEQRPCVFCGKEGVGENNGVHITKKRVLEKVRVNKEEDRHVHLRKEERRKMKKERKGKERSR